MTEEANPKPETKDSEDLKPTEGEKPEAAAAPKEDAPADPGEAAEKPAATAAAKPVAETVAAPAGKAQTEGGKKEKGEKVVRASFSMPKSEHAQLKVLRKELAKAGRPASRSELLRAGLRLLAAHSGKEVAALVEALPVVPKGKGKK